MIAYSDRKPTQPGYFWMKYPVPGEHTQWVEMVVKIYKCGGELFHLTKPVAAMHGRLFAGPIPRPAEARCPTCKGRRKVLDEINLSISDCPPCTAPVRERGRG